MEFKRLKKEIPHKWRVQSAKNGRASCVAYIDARDVMDLLDDVCQPHNWQSKFELIDGKLFCGLGIKYENEWIWKYDTGTESNIEKEKGEVSDALKRAAVQWGIGRFLYALDIITLKTKEYNGKEYPIDDNGKTLYGDELTLYCNKLQTDQANTNNYKDIFDDTKDKEQIQKMAKEIKEALDKGLINEQDITGTLRLNGQGKFIDIKDIKVATEIHRKLIAQAEIKAKRLIEESSK